VHDIFTEEGANGHTIWLWSPNRVNRICGQRRPSNFYPGDQYVDWIGMSGYYRNYDAKGGSCDDISATFDGVFGNTLPELRNIAGSKPIFLSEIGATERGGDKAAWIADLFRGLKDNTDIIGFAWFSLAVSSGGETDRFTHDWRINSSPEAVNAMKSGLAESGFGQPPTG
jgi:beta-mannanase